MINIYKVPFRLDQSAMHVFSLSRLQFIKFQTKIITKSCWTMFSEHDEMYRKHDEMWEGTRPHERKKKLLASCSQWLPKGKHWQILHGNLLGTSSQLYVNDWCHNLGCRCLVYHIVRVTCMPTTVQIINDTQCKNCLM